MKFIPCHNCGKEIPENMKWKDHAGHTYCSKECKWEGIYTWDCSRKGERPRVPGSWDWVINQVFKRDNYCCRLCGKTHKDLYWEKNSESVAPERIKNILKCNPSVFHYLFEFHHNLPIAIGGNSLPENVITLCHDCHVLVHSSLRKKSDQEPGISDSSELHQTSLIRFMDAVIQERC
ncbi:HNH endonuclease [Methanoplanus limicola]|uniref:HNH domain-containing protein n=1 Tax=Methanoplanus limicola DSM 2279 TaxID=937775 RepID=H1Z196_9EURY|nr:HNH endonuclease [Methanoplanus limicola]EHQ35363.1 hypothetical protein Metlim_1254 [Methanoplanus limicola DSM 2279]